MQGFGSYSLKIVLLLLAKYVAGAAVAQRHSVAAVTRTLTMSLDLSGVAHASSIPTPTHIGGIEPARVRLPKLSPAQLRATHTHAYLAMCVVTDDKGSDVREWIDHYLKLGVGHFYIHQQSSTWSVTGLADLVLQGLVEYELIAVSA